MSSEASLDTTYESLPSGLCCQLPCDTITRINFSSSSSDLKMWEGTCDLSIFALAGRPGAAVPIW